MKNGEYFSPQDYTLKRDNLIEGNGAGFHSAIKRFLTAVLLLQCDRQEWNLTRQESVLKDRLLA